MSDDREKTTTSIGVFGWLLFGLSWCLVAVTLPFSLCVLLKVQYSTVQYSTVQSPSPSHSASSSRLSPSSASSLTASTDDDYGGSSHRIAMHIQGVQKIEIIFITAILTRFTLFWGHPVLETVTNLSSHASLIFKDRIFHCFLHKVKADK